jgi:HemY protein
MIRIMIFIVIAAVLVGITTEIAKIPGEVTINWEGWRIVAPIPLLLLLFSVLVAAGVLVYAVSNGLWRIPAKILSIYRRSREERGYRALTQGMVAVAAGDAREARRQANRANALLSQPPLTMLLSAQAAQLQGDEEAATRYFTAMLAKEETAFLGLRGLLIQAQKSGDRAEALRLAERANLLHPKTGWVLNTIYELHTEGRDWESAARTLEDLRKTRSLDAETISRRRASIALLQCADATAKNNKTGRVSAGKLAYKIAPKWLPTCINLAEIFEDTGEKNKALKLIKKNWSKYPHYQLAQIYNRCLSDNNPIQIVPQIEKLISKDWSHPESQIALGEAMLNANLWGAARVHLEAALKVRETSFACRLMARLEEEEKRDLDASNKWLKRATDLGLDKFWQCTDCKGSYTEFSPDCKGCRGLGTLNWRETPESLPVSQLGEPREKSTEVSKSAISLQ